MVTERPQMVSIKRQKSFKELTWIDLTLAPTMVADFHLILVAPEMLTGAYVITTTNLGDV
jgi:hypothetical protein